ncbi:MAG: M13 family metallopeptidase [Saprospiraceae bacterium]
MKRFTPLVAFATLLLVGAFADLSAQTDEPSGINLDYMDTTVSPAEDFFRYVNGNWLDQTEIPADRERWGSFDELRKRTDAQTLDVLKSAAAASGKYAATTDQGKAAIYFAVAQDTNALNKLGISPLQPWLDKIDAIKTYADVAAFQQEVLPYGGDALFSFGIGSNPKNSNEKVIYVGGGSLGLPDRDYYLDEDSTSTVRRGKYVMHVARMLEFTGMKPMASKLAAARVMDFETAVAKTKLDKVARRDPYKRFNPRSVAQLKEIVPAVDWKGYFAAAGMDVPDTVILGETAYMDHLGEVLAEADIPTIKDYLRWHAIDQAATSLTTEIDRANWEFYSKELRGAKQQRSREERALSTTNRTLGEAVGRLYVDKYFPAEAKTVAIDMVNNLRRAYETRINNLEWMTAETKVKAIEKLGTFRVKIGYPDKWKDYSKLEVKSIEAGGSYLGNKHAARKFNFDKDIAEAKKPVDKDEWFMSPQTVNAYYNPAYNEIVFPASILQPPFYDYKADAAVNYGGIGAVIGHEISHGFDDKGSEYDKDGNLNSWWTDGDRTAFEARNDKLIAQFDAFEPLPGVNVNGEFTLGENIGDLGGINSAYDGLQIHLKENGHPGKIDGFSPEQRFFISWGTIWRTKYRDKALENQVKTDPHSPGMYRAVGPVINLQTFYDAFDIKADNPNYVKPEDRVIIW